MIALIRKKDLSQLKEDIGFCIGQRVRLTTNKGKKKVLTKEGVVESAYPNVFTVKFEGEQSSRRIAYSYTDVLTNAVEVIRCSDNLNIQDMMN